MTRSASWPTIILIWLYGVMAGASLGKVIPVMGSIIGGLRVTPDQAGWVISLATLVSVLTAPQGGWLIDRIGDRRVMALGAAAGILGNFGAVLSGSFPLLIAARIVESIGVTGLVLGGTTMMIRVTHGAQRNRAMGLWATSVPVGLGVSEGMASLWAKSGWHGPFLVHGLVLIAALIAVRLLPAWQATEGEEAKPGMFAIYRHAAPLRLGFALTCVVICQFGAATIFPGYLLAAHGQAIAVAGTIGGVASLCTVFGSNGSGYLLNHGWSPVSIASLAVGLVGLCGALTFLPADNVAVAGVFLCLCNLGAGLAIGLGFALIPSLAPSHAYHSAASSLCNQLVNLGFVLGAPLAVAAIRVQISLGPLALMAAMGVFAFLLLPRARLVR